MTEIIFWIRFVGLFLILLSVFVPPIQVKWSGEGMDRLRTGPFTFSGWVLFIGTILLLVGIAGWMLMQLQPFGLAALSAPLNLL